MVDATVEAESLRKANEAMKKYEDYIDELSFRYPETFKKLDDFFKRGNCRCSLRKTCKCTQVGLMCDCGDPKTCSCGQTDSTSKCFTHRLKHRVRVYDIDTTATTWEKFLTSSGPDHNGQNYFDAGREEDLQQLKVNLQKGSLEEAGGKKVTKNTHFRLITVGHLSANVAKLLGGLYDIHADFFNRHLPGTEAISGRLLSRVPSAIQIEFDELYEAHDTFKNIWKNKDKEPDGLRGHQLIQDALKQNFLIRQAGWDYFPISEKDWAAGQDNTPMSAGFEDVDAENIFQFNLAHRVSVYSIPKGHQGHPRTAIILFYPRLELCNEPKHFTEKIEVKGRPDISLRGHAACADRSECKVVPFRSIPDTVPPMSDVTHTKVLRARKELLPSEEYLYGNSKHELKNKWDYAAGFHKEFMIHVKKHHDRFQEEREEERKAGRDPDKLTFETDFIHFFGFPLFRMVAANWARLIHKRGLDLDMLEWRPHCDVDTDGSMHTVQETKSRRGALVRHQKAITATLEMLRHLKQQEKTARCRAELAGLADDSNFKELENIRLKYSDDDNEYNKGLSDGLSGEDADGDTWESLYYDFFELKAGVDALEKRADKIAESMLAMMNVRIQSSSRDIWTVNTEIQSSTMRSNERAGALNNMVAVASVVLGSFTIVDAVYSSTSNLGAVIPTATTPFWNLWGIVLCVTTVAALGYLLYMRKLDNEKDKNLGKPREILPV